MLLFRSCVPLAPNLASLSMGRRWQGCSFGVVSEHFEHQEDSVANERSPLCYVEHCMYINNSLNQSTPRGERTALTYP
jgi:hypothetical protein